MSSGPELRCKNHPDKDIYGLCVKCNAGLCRDCAIDYDGNRVICDSCKKKEDNQASNLSKNPMQISFSEKDKVSKENKKNSIWVIIGRVVKSIFYGTILGIISYMIIFGSIGSYFYSDQPFVDDGICDVDKVNPSIYVMYITTDSFSGSSGTSTDMNEFCVFHAIMWAMKNPMDVLRMPLEIQIIAIIIPLIICLLVSIMIAYITLYLLYRFNINI